MGPAPKKDAAAPRGAAKGGAGASEFTGLKIFGRPASDFISWAKPQYDWGTRKPLPLKRSRWLIKPEDLKARGKR